MIDWIDVNKELPENESKVKVKTNNGRTITATFYDEYSKFTDDTFVSLSFCGVCKENDF